MAGPTLLDNLLKRSICLSIALDICSNSSWPSNIPNLLSSKVICKLWPGLIVLKHFTQFFALCVCGQQLKDGRHLDKSFPKLTNLWRGIFAIVWCFTLSAIVPDLAIQIVSTYSICLARKWFVNCKLWLGWIVLGNSPDCLLSVSVANNWRLGDF